MRQLASGVYLVRCLPTNKVYVGSSANIKARWNLHQRQLIKGNHINRYLQAAWNKHGCAAFVWEVIEYTESDKLIEREQHFIESLQSNKRDFGFNLRRFAHSNLGIKLPGNGRNRKGSQHSAETRAKMKEAFERRTPEQKAEIRRKQSESQRGKRVTQETKDKISEKLRGRPGRVPSPETLAKLSKAARGKTHSAETRAKLSTTSAKHSQAHGNNHPRFSPESRAKQAATRKGKPLSKQNREAITLAMRRLHSSPERLQAKQDRLQAKEQARIKRQEEKDWEKSVKRCIRMAKFLSPETQARRTAGVPTAHESGKFNYSAEGRARMAEGARKAALSKKAKARQQQCNQFDSMQSD